MKVTIPRDTLRRLAERFDQPSVELSATGARVSLGLARSPHAGGGVAWLRLEGVDVGEQVELALPERATIEGAVSADEAQALTGAGSRLLQVLQGLCRCARMPGDCDCCAACAGKGSRERAGGEEVCWTCAGLGYEADDARAGTERTHVVSLRVP